MLTKSKQRQLLNALKEYHRRYLKKEITDLDESGTRLMINSFLTEVLGFKPIEEVKTEYMIRGTYADYVVQLKGVRHFLVEVKALSLELSDKHLRQAINYAANEGIEWVLLTNGKKFDLYTILFNKPIEAKKVFSVDLYDSSKLKDSVELIQYLTKISVADKGLSVLLNKCEALNPSTVAGLLHNKPIINFIKRALKKKYKIKFTDDEVIGSINKIINEPIQLDDIKRTTVGKKRKKRESADNAENEVIEAKTETKPAIAAATTDDVSGVTGEEV